MNAKRGGLVPVLAAGALLALPMSNTRVTRLVSRASASQPDDPKTLYVPQQREFWLSADEFAYVRPGLKITVNSVTLDAGLHPVVDVSYTDDGGVPLDRAGAVTPGAISMSFVLAWWDPASGNYTSYTTRVQTSPITHVSATQAGADSGGTWTDLDIGHSVYTFKTALPAGYDQTITTTLGIYSTRATSDIVGKDYYANVEYDFVPNGAPVTAVWDMISTSACNTCHNPLSAHGGSRLRRQAVRPVPLAPDDRSRHGQHGRLQGDGPQDPHGREPAERPGRARPTRSSASSSPSSTSRTSSSRRTFATARRAMPRRRRRRPTGTPTPAAPRASRAMTTSTSRPARTTRPDRRPTTAPARPATSRRAAASGTRPSSAPTRSRPSRRS